VYCNDCCQYVEETEQCDEDHDDWCESCGQVICRHGDEEA
jgi:hypothetical protein